MVETSRPIPPETGHPRRKKSSESPKEKVRKLKTKLKEIADRKPSAEVQEALAALKEPSETERALADVRAAIAEKKAEDKEGRAPSARLIIPKKAEIVSGEIDTERAAKKKRVAEADYESLEVIEEDLSEGMQKEIDKIIDTFHQAKTQNEFLDLVLKKSNFLLSQEKVTADPAVRKYLEAHFKPAGEFGPKLEDFIFMLPTEQEFAEHAGKKRRTLEIKTHKVIPAPELISADTKQKMAENSEAHKNEKYLEKTVELFLAEDAAGFRRLMLEGDLVHYALTKEDAAKDAFASVLLKYLIENGQGKKELKALVAALPTKQEYDTEGWPAQKRSEVQELGRRVRRKSDEFMAQSEAWEIFKQAIAAYAKAYKKFDPKFTEDKPHSLIALTRPPLLAFSAPAKELKRLYKALNIARKNAEREDEEEKIKQNLAAARSKPVTNKEALPAEARAALAKSSQAEEEAAGVKTLSDEAAWYQPEEEKKKTGFEPVPRADYLRPQPEKIKMPKTRAELSEGIRSSEKVVDYLGGVLEQQAAGKKKRTDEISKYFMRKNKMSAESVHKFLMGEEIKGLFNGSQRKMQREYQSLYNSPVYKEWLKLGGE